MKNEACYLFPKCNDYVEAFITPKHDQLCHFTKHKTSANLTQNVLLLNSTLAPAIDPLVRCEEHNWLRLDQLTVDDSSLFYHHQGANQTHLYRYYGENETEKERRDSKTSRGKERERGR